MNFSYVAINSKYQKVTGVIDAGDAEQAKEQLHKMGFSVLEIGETLAPVTEQAATLQETVPTFWFLVRDQNGQESEGTIEALDRKNAFRRLRSEYKFEVLALCSSQIPAEERRAAGAMGLEELAEELHQEVGLETGISPADDADIEVVADKHFQQQRKQILEEVDRVTKKAEEILATYKEKISGEEFRSIKTAMDTLMRIKLSNNIEYIKDLAEELFESIRQVLQKYENPAAMDTSISNIDPQIADQTPGDAAITDALQEQIHNRSLKNTLTLGSLKSISARLSVMGAHTFQQNLDPDSSPMDAMRFRLKLIKEGVQAIFMPTKEHREKFSLSWQSWQDFRREKHLQNTAVFPLVLSELKFVTGWLLGFYLLFFLILEQLVMKGVWFELGSARHIFGSSFLIFFVVFLFFANAALSLWQLFGSGKIWKLLPIGLLTTLLFLIFTINF